MQLRARAAGALTTKGRDRNANRRDSGELNNKRRWEAIRPTEGPLNNQKEKEHV